MVSRVAAQTLHNDIDNSHRLALLRGRTNSSEGGVFAKTHQRYLDVLIPAHRKALTRLMFSEHPLAVEQLRRATRYHRAFERHERICRLCHGEVEDEMHIISTCSGNQDLLLLRTEMIRQLNRFMPHLPPLAEDARTIREIIAGPPDAIAALARFVHRAFQVVSSVPMLLPGSTCVYPE
ncbi:hypothetical protein HDZ31DRAFT_48578 [Schizophyllum fasciatum]